MELAGLKTMTSNQKIDGHDNFMVGPNANVKIEKHDHTHHHDYSLAPNAKPSADKAREQFNALPTDKVPKPAPLAAGSRIEFPINPAFIGRDAALLKLAMALKGSDITAIGQITAATGLGGIGKTQLASEFAHRYGQYFAGGVFWLNCERAENMEAELMACAATMIGDPAISDAMPPSQLIATLTTEWQSPIPRLLVFDNCEDPTLLEHWRPPSGGCRILITSRKSAWPLDIKTLSLDVLERADSIALLIHGRANLNADDPSIDAIAEELGDLPLALHLAGRYLATYCDDDIGQPTTYLTSLQTALALTHDSIDHPNNDHGETTTRHTASVSRTFALSYQQLAGDAPTNTLARQLLACAACLAPGKPIPRALLKTLPENNHDETQIADALNLLQRELGLLTREKSGELVLHRLLAVFVATQEYDGSLPQKQVEQVLSEQAKQINDAGLPAPLRAWLPHLQHVAEMASQRGSQHASRLFNRLGYHLNMEGLYASAKATYERALKIDEAHYGQENPDIARGLTNLGGVLEKLSDLVGAKAAFERALKIGMSIHGENHPTISACINNLGRVLEKQGNLVGAKAAYQRALKIDVFIYGEKHPNVAIAVSNLGGILEKEGDLVSAKAAFEHALQIHEDYYEYDNPHIAVCINNLGRVLEKQGDQASAKAAFERALKIFENALPRDHPYTQIVRENLSSLDGL